LIRSSTRQLKASGNVLTNLVGSMDGQLFSNFIWKFVLDPDLHQPQPQPPLQSGERDFMQQQHSGGGAPEQQQQQQQEGSLEEAREQGAAAPAAAELPYHRFGAAPLPQTPEPSSPTPYYYYYYHHHYYTLFQATHQLWLFKLIYPARYTSHNVLAKCLQHRECVRVMDGDVWFRFWFKVRCQRSFRYTQVAEAEGDCRV
jgi:hypothetical protein